MMLHEGHPDHITLWLYSDSRLSHLMGIADSGSDSWRYQDQ